MRTLHQKISTILVLAGILLISACQADDPSRYNPILTSNNEADLGEALVSATLADPSQFPILPPESFPKVYHYLGQVMDMVAIQTEIGYKFDWEIFVVDDDFTKNAFTLPGGKMFITTGFLKYLRSEHQLIALVAHEAHYADRSDQTGQGNLSTTMLKLKESEDYGTSGTHVFIDVINGNDSEAMDMVSYAASAKYVPQEVLDADAFYLSLICENYLYSALGIKELIDQVELDELEVFEWFENKPPMPNSMLFVNNTTIGPFVDYRIDQIVSGAEPSICGTENTLLNTNNYTEFLDYLP